MSLAGDVPVTDGFCRVDTGRHSPSRHSDLSARNPRSPVRERPGLAPKTILNLYSDGPG